MGKWRETYDSVLGGCVDVDGTLYSSNSNLAALQLIGVHNVDIDALTAERDQWRDRAVEAQAERDAAREQRDLWQSRCEAIVAELEPEEKPEYPGEDSPISHWDIWSAKFTPWRVTNDLHARAVAIMKGEKDD